MSALTIRGLANDTHDTLRQLAASRAQSLESMVRDALAALAVGETVMALPASQPPGFAEQNFAWPLPSSEPACFETLWGALKGKVHIPPGTDLTAPGEDAWDAEAGLL